MTERDDQGKSGDNVVALGTAKKGRRQQSKQQRSEENAHKKATKAAALEQYFMALSGQPGLWPDFPRKFRIISDATGVRSYVEINAGDVVTHIPNSTVRDALLNYNRSMVQAAFLDSPSISSKEATELATVWAACQVPIDETSIAGVRELSEPGLCWQRLEFDLAEGPTPTFDELFGRMDTNALAVKAWIGSLFDPKSSRQQYVWLHGDGRNGKSSLIGLLKRIFKATYKAAYVPKNGVNNFWTRSLLGKRLVAFSDFSNFNFVSEDIFKSLTGGDAMETEIKGGAHQTSDMICKIIFASNVKPNVTSGASDTRRTIYCELRPVEGELLGKEEYEERLWSEASAFLWTCKKAYEPWAKAAEIPVDKDALDNLVAANEEKWRVLVDEYFEIGAEFQTTPNDLYIVAHKLAGLSDKEIGTLKTYLERAHKVKKKRDKPVEGKPRGWFYSGMQVSKITEGKIHAERNKAF